LALDGLFPVIEDLRYGLVLPGARVELQARLNSGEVGGEQSIIGESAVDDNEESAEEVDCKLQ
jgi:hypothetical protein